jgi:DNA replication and repair protein RecF
MSASRLRRLTIADLRSYASLDATFPGGPILVVGPNASGKTTLLEAIVLAARGRSARTAADAELVRFGSDLLRVEAQIGPDDEPGPPIVVELAIGRPTEGGRGHRKRLRVDGVARRIGTLGTFLRVVLFAPEDMALVAGPPALRRSMIDELAGALSPGYAADLATYARALSQRNSLLRAIREDAADRAELHLWDVPLVDAGSRVVEQRLALLERMAGPLAAAHAEIAPEEGSRTGLGLRHETNAPTVAGETVRAALERRLAETAEKEVWNGATLIGPHRDDVVFTLGGRDLASFGSRGQQRTAILATKLAEIDLLSVHDGRPPLLLLDDVFSELDTDRRSHLVRRLTALPQAFVTTTTAADLDPALVERATTYAVEPDVDGRGARLRPVTGGPG